MTNEAPDPVEMPRPTVAPLVLSVGLSLLAAGIAFGMAFVVIGAAVALTGLGLWIAQLLPGAGHEHMPRAEQRPRPLQGRAGGVEQLRPGMPGYRFRLPVEVHPVSAGIKGGIAGGLVMPAPALLWGLLSGHGIWYPVNLLAGMVLPGVDQMSVAELEQFHAPVFATALVIHATVSVVLGLIYGTLLPTLPHVPRPIAWGGLLAPLVWTGVSFAFMGVVNPPLQDAVSWPWFAVSQFVFGIVAAAVILQLEDQNSVAAGLRGGAAGGLFMPLPAFLWAILHGHTPWYPVNLLAGMVLTELGERPLAHLEELNLGWLIAASIVHAALSLGFGVLLALLRPRLPVIPAPVAWGGLVLPLLWTGTSYGLMGVVNPVLQEHVDWFWFVVSQFVYGIVAAVVVLRSEMIAIPPAGRGPDRAGAVLTGEGGNRP